MPRWIDRDGAKLERQRQIAATHAALLERHKARRAEEADIAARSKAAEAARVPAPRGRGIRPGTRKLPDLSEAELAAALALADPETPRHLDYPHLLIFRERGWTHMVWGGVGEFGVPTYQGDVLSEEGRQWLNRLTRA